jgi:7-carboxy-7-deazaguanine synthase
MYCDSMFAVEPKEGEWKEISEQSLLKTILKLANNNSDRSRVCWTGGEPLLQAEGMAYCISHLPLPWQHTVETAGEIPFERLDKLIPSARTTGRVRYIMDVKCPGSGMPHNVAFTNLKKRKPQDEVKFVITNREDYEFAKTVIKDFYLTPELTLFSPVNPSHKVSKGLPLQVLAEWVLRDGLDVRLQPQVHKYIWPGKERGV